MSNLYFDLSAGTLEKLEESDILGNGVQALSKQPTRQSAFGEGGLDATELKKRFDKLPTLLAQKINAILNALSSGGDDLKISLGEEKISLFTLAEEIKNGRFAARIQALSGKDLKSVQTIIEELLKSISDMKKTLDDCEKDIEAEEKARKEGDVYGLNLEFDKYSQKLTVRLVGLEGKAVASGTVFIPDRETQRLIPPVAEHVYRYNAIFSIGSEDGGRYVDGYRIYVECNVGGVTKQLVLSVEKPAAVESVTVDMSELLRKEGADLLAGAAHGTECTFGITAVGLGMLESEEREVKWFLWIPTREVIYEGGIAVGINEEVGEEYIGERALVIAGQLSDGTQITAVGEEAFINKSGYTELWLPPTVQYVGRNAFKNCSGITRVVAPSLAEYCSTDFSNSGAAPLYNGTNTTEGANGKAILVCDGEQIAGELVIPDGVRKIGARVFYYLTAITGLVIPDSVKEIGPSAFCGCLSLKRAEIGNGVTVLPSGLFYNCPALETVRLPSGLVTIGDEAFSTCPNLSEVEIPDSVTSIGQKAFLNDSKITALVVPKSVESIGANAFLGVDASLTELSLPFVGRGPYEETYYFLGSIFGKGAYGTTCCSKITKLTLTPSESGCVLRENALSGAKGLTALSVVGGRITIRAGAVPTQITSMKVDGATLVIAEGAFLNTGITRFCIGDVGAYCESDFQSSNSGSGEPAQYPYNSPLNSNPGVCLVDEDGSVISEIIVPDGTERIATHAFYRPWSHRDYSIRRISLPASLKSIGGRGFMGQIGVTEIEFRGEESDAEDLIIGFYGFVNMQSLRNLYLPDRVKEIGKYAIHSNIFDNLRINTDCKISSDALGKTRIENFYITCSEEEAMSKGYPWGAEYVGNVYFNSDIKEF